MKKTLLFLFLLLPFLPGCLRDVSEQPELPGSAFVSFDVSVAGEDEEGQTRSQLSVSGAEKIYKVALFAFDNETGNVIMEGGRPCVKYSGQTSFSWSLPAGRALDIYAVVNYGTLDLEPFASDPSLTEEKLANALVFSCPSETDFSRLDESGYGIPMAGIVSGRVLSAEEALTVTVRKLFARYDLYLDKDFYAGTGLTVTAACIRSVLSNTEVPYFRDGFAQTDPSKLREMDYATDNDLLRFADGGPDHCVTLYLPENCQGYKTPAANWYSVESVPGNDLSLCTRLRIMVEASDAFNNRQTMDYSVYPGKDLGGTQGNFDVRRNRRQTLGLRLGAGPAFVLDIEGAIYLPASGTLTIPFAARGITSASQIEDRSADAPAGFSLTGKTLVEGEYSVGGISYPQHGSLTLKTDGVPFGTAFLFSAGTQSVRDSKNVVILPSGIEFEGENRSYMPDYDPEGSVDLVSSASYALDPSRFSGLEVAFSRNGTYFGQQPGSRQYVGSASFLPSVSEPGRYRLKVSIPYSTLTGIGGYGLRGPGRILARARSAAGGYVYFTIGTATVRLCLALCSYLVGPAGFSKTTNVTSGFVPYSVPLRFLCPGIYCPDPAVGRFSFTGYDDEDPDDNGRFHLPFRVEMDPNTIRLGGSYYTVNERGTNPSVRLHVPSVEDGNLRGTSVSVYVYEYMADYLLGTDWYDADIEDWSADSPWYEGDRSYPEDLFPYKGRWSIRWSGPSIRYSYTGSSGTGPDDRNYQDIDVINLINSSGSRQNYYLRVYDWTEDSLDAISDDLEGLYE